MKRRPSQIVLDSVGKGSVDLDQVASQIDLVEKLAHRISSGKPQARKPEARKKEKSASRVLPRNNESVEKVTDLVEQLKSLGSGR